MGLGMAPGSGTLIWSVVTGHRFLFHSTRILYNGSDDSALTTTEPTLSSSAYQRLKLQGKGER